MTVATGEKLHGFRGISTPRPGGATGRTVGSDRIPFGSCMCENGAFPQCFLFPEIPVAGPSAPVTSRTAKRAAREDSLGDLPQTTIIE